MDTGEREGLGVELGEILIGLLEGILPSPAVKLVTLAFHGTVAAVTSRSRPPFRDARRSLEQWAKEGISRADIEAGARVAAECLRQWGPLTVGHLRRFGADRDAIARDIASIDHETLEDGEDAAFRYLVLAVVTAALEDTDTRDLLGLPLVAGLASSVTELRKSVERVTPPTGLIEGDLDRLVIYSRTLVERRLAAGPGRRIVRSPAVTRAAATLEQPAWSARVHAAAAFIQNVITPRAAGDLAELAIRTEASDESLLESLRGIDLERLRRAVARVGDVHLRADAETKLEWLIHEAEAPGFHRMIAVAGRWGSGRSLCCWELARSALDRGAVVLELDRRLGGSFDNALARQLEVALRGRPTLFIEVLRDLARHRRTLLIVIDEADEWALRDETFVAQFVERVRTTTGFADIRWLVSADTANLDILYREAEAGFWPEYARFSAQHPTDEIEGWIDLDQVNVEYATGHRIIAREASAEIHASVSAYALTREWERDSAWDLLCQPLPAWTWLDDRSTPPASFDDAAFADAYWRAAERRLQSAATSGRLVGAVLSHLAEASAITAGEQVRVEEIERELFGRHPGYDDLERLDSVLASLAAARLIELDRDEVLLGTHTLWASRIAALFDSDNLKGEEAISTEMSRWTASADRRIERLRDAVLGEWLVRIAATPGLARTSARVATSLLKSSQRGAPVWAAVLRLPIEQQQTLATYVINASHVARNSQELFLMLRWYLHAPDAVWQPRDALGSLVWSAGLAVRSGLDGYFATVAERFIARWDASTVDQQVALLALLGSASAAGDPHGLAAAFLESARRDSNDEVLLAAVTRHGETFRAREQVATGSLDGAVPNAFAFLDKLVDAVAHDVVRDDVRTGRTVLERAGWFDPVGRSPSVHEVMRRAAHRAIGHAYPTQSGAVNAIVEQYVRGDASELASSLFIIRHTESTHGRADIKVDDSFAPALRQLSRRRQELSHADRRWLRSLLEANGMVW